MKLVMLLLLFLVSCNNASDRKAIKQKKYINCKKAESKKEYIVCFSCFTEY